MQLDAKLKNPDAMEMFDIQKGGENSDPVILDDLDASENSLSHMGVSKDNGTPKSSI